MMFSMEPKVPQVDIPQIKPAFQELPKEGMSSESPSILIPKTEVIRPKVSSGPKKVFLTSKVKKIFLGGGTLLTAIIVLMVVPGLIILGKGKALYNQSKSLAAAAKASKIPAVKAEIGETKTALTAFRSSFKFISWTKYIPLIGLYVSDIDHATKAYDYGLDGAETTITVIEPYADVLGIATSEVTKDGSKTAKDRIDFIAKAIPTILPKIDEIVGSANKAKLELDQINPDRYPVKFRGKEVREPMRKGLAALDEAVSVIGGSKPLLEATPYLLGLDSPREYLVLFQNDKELRPTGGFMTAYAIMKVDQAKFQPVSSNDIYNLDAQYRPRVPAPAPVVKYLKGPYALSPNLRLRDMNWSPDFAESMKTFSQEIAAVGVKGLDGIIAVDTELLTNLLDAIGPIGVPGFGNFSTKIEPKCNCPQVIYELESFADVEGPIIWDPLTHQIIQKPANSDNRKKIIGPLMNSILANAMGQPKDKLPALAAAAFKSLLEKHVLFYLSDAKAQAGVSAFGIGGRMLDASGDYLAINDSNLGGRKSNLYVSQEVEQNFEVKNGAIEKTLTITYKNPEKQDGWLNSVLPDWVRIYVPKGSQLLAQEGFEDKAEPYEEFGKTVFAGFFELRPEGVSKLTLKYRLPFTDRKKYQLFIQKQPGTDSPLYTINYGKKTEEFFLTRDRQLTFSL